MIKTTERRRKKRRTRWPLAVVTVLLVLVMLWVIAVFSPTPIISTLRDTWIETAMNTFTHKWLATAFFPPSVIEDTMSRARAAINASMVEESAPPPGSDTVTDDGKPEEDPHGAVTPGTLPAETLPNTDPVISEPEPDYALERLLEYFPELDPTTIPEDFSKTYDLDSLQIKDIVSLGIKTTAGDEVWAIDRVNGVLIMVVRGSFSELSFYEGKLALVRGSDRTRMVVNKNSGQGTTLERYVKNNDAILGINANGFADENGEGKGHELVGLVMASGVKYGENSGDVTDSYGGFDKDDNFLVGWSVNPEKLRDCAQFHPVVVRNGESNISKANRTMGYGLQPRSVIGQTASKDTLFLVIDGRQAHSVGATPYDCAQILLRYGCWSALNMDGGSSATMVYDGETITKSSSPQVGGRFLPCAWIVDKK